MTEHGLTVEPVARCTDPRCGQPIRGRPRTGWWRVRVDSDHSVWCCSEDCARRIGGSDADTYEANRVSHTGMKLFTHETRCGQPGGLGLIPPPEWIGIVRPGRDEHGRRRVDVKVWYCSAECVADSLGVRPVVPSEAEATLADLNRFAGTQLTVMDVTPHRLRVALDRAFSRILVGVDEWQREQEANRPTTAELLDEAAAMAGSNIPPIAERKRCGGCLRHLPADGFSESQWDGRTGAGRWCRSCVRRSSERRQERLDTTGAHRIGSRSAAPVTGP